VQILTTLVCLFFTTIIFAEHGTELEQAHEHINAMQYTEAANSINQHLATQANDVKALHLLAKTYAWDNNYNLAEQTYSRLLGIDAQNPEYLFGKGNALVWLQKNKQAIPYLEQAWGINKNNSNYLKTLILTLNQTANKQNLKRAKVLSTMGQKKFPNQLWD